MGDLLTILIEYGHSVACDIDVSTVVDSHSIRPHVGKYLAVELVMVRIRRKYNAFFHILQ